MKTAEDFDYFAEQEEPQSQAENAARSNGREEKQSAGCWVHSELTEELLAQRFESRWGGTLCFDHNVGRWFIWSPEHGCWRKNETRLAFHYARDICRESNIFTEKSFARAAMYAGVERICQASPQFAVTSEIWDLDLWLLGVPGGTVDLRTGKLRAARKEDRITKQTAVAPDWQLPCPVFTKFLHEITKGNEELKTYLQRMAGYASTGSIREEKIFFIYGPGGNGKSKFLNAIMNVLGDYASDAPIDTFVRKRGERHPTDLASLRGARLVTATETDEGRQWDEALIKKVTGGDPVTARFMRRDFFSFTPQLSLIIAGNHAPSLSNVGDSIRRRFQIIPFDFKPDKPDDQLEGKLRSEGPAILAWIIDGARAWDEHGLPQPEAVVEETGEYFTGQDQLQEWIDQCCLVGPNYSDQSRVVFDSWRDWARPRGALEEAPSNKRLTGLLKDRRLVRARHSDRGTILHGIAVKVEYKPDPRTGERDE